MVGLRVLIYPGWYRDPHIADLARFWDGENWTEYTARRNPMGRLAVDDVETAMVLFIDDQVLKGVDPPVGRRLRDSVHPWCEEQRRSPGWVRRFNVGVPLGLPLPVGMPLQIGLPDPRPVAPLGEPLISATQRPEAQVAPEVVVRTPSPPLRPPAEVRPQSQQPPARPVPAGKPVPFPGQGRLRPTRVPAPPQPPRTLVRRHRPVRTTRPVRTEPAWPARLWAAIVSDVGVHGLAYLGITLMLAGLTGFAVFAFGSVGSGWRPVAEVLAPAVIIVSGVYLRRRQASEVGMALMIAGLALVPVALVASLVDGSPVPDDLTGRALVAAAAALVAATALVYAVVAWRSPASAAAWLVAPVSWMAVGIASHWPHAEEVRSRGIAGIGAAQVAALAAAVALTAVVGRWWKTVPFAKALQLTSAGGVVVVVAVAAVQRTQDEWTTAPAVVFGLSLLLATEALAPRVPTWVVGPAQAAALAVAVVGMTDEIPLGWSGLAGVIAGLVLLEWTGWRRAHPAGLVAAGVTVVGALGAALTAPWSAVVAAASLGAWAHVRRVRRPAWLPEPVVTPVAGVAPVVAAWALFLAAPPTTAALVVAAGAALTAVAVPVRWVDRFLAWFLGVWAHVAAGVALVVVAAIGADGDSGTRLAVASALAVVAIWFGPTPMVVRVWTASAAALQTAAIAAAVAGVGVRWQLAALAAVGAVVTLVSLARPGRRADSSVDTLAGHLGLVGWTAQAAAVVTWPFLPDGPDRVLGMDNWAFTGLLAGLAATTAATAWRAEHGGAAPVMVAARNLGLGESAGQRWSGSLALAVWLGIATAVSGAASAGWLADDAGVAALIVALAAVAMAAIPAVFDPLAHVARPLTDSAAAAAAVALTLTFGAPIPVAMGTAGIATSATVMIPVRWRRTWVPVVGAGGVLTAAGFAVGEGWAMLAVAVVALAVAAIARLRPVQDSYRAAAGAVLSTVAAAGAFTVTAEAEWLWAGSALVAAAALVLADFAAVRLPRTVQVWLVAIAGVHATVASMSALGVPARPQLVVLAWASAVAVAVAVLAPHRAGSAAIHVAGLLGTAASVAVVGGLESGATAEWTTDWPRVHGWAMTLTLAALTAAWVVTTVADARGEAPAAAALRRWIGIDGPGPLDLVPAIVALGSGALLAVSTVDSAGWTDTTGVRAGLVLAAVAVAYSALTRAPLPPAVVRPAGWWSPVLGTVAVGLAMPEPWPLALTATALPVAALATAPAQRASWTPWLAWTGTGLAAVQYAVLAGVAESRAHLVAFVVGSVMVLGALGLEYRAHPEARGPHWATGVRLAPASLGAAGAVAGLAPVYRLADTTWGGWSLAAAVVVFAVAVLTEIGVLSAAGWILLAGGVAGVTSVDPADEPIWLVVAAAVLMAVSAGADVVEPRRLRLRGWSLAARTVGTVALVAAVVLAPAASTVTSTWTAAGLLAIAVGAWRRQWWWAATGLVLVDFGAAAASTGWLAITMAATSASATLAAARLTGWRRLTLQIAGALAAAGAWTSTTVYLEWDRAGVATVTALVAGAVVLWHAVALRVLHLERSWALVWGSLGLAGLASTPGLGAGTDRLSTGLGLAGGLALAATGFVVAAAPLAAPWLRSVAAVGYGLSVAAVWHATEAQPEVMVGVGLAASTVAVVLLVAAHRLERHLPWVVPVTVVLAEAWLVTVVAVGLDWPSRPLAIAALMVAAGQSTAVGLLWPSAVARLAAPVLFVAAWLMFATEARRGDPLWLTTPIGLGLLVEVELVRADTRRAGGRGTPLLAVLAELTGMALLVVPTLIEAVTDTLVLGALAAAWGLAFVGWSVTSRVRRRLAAGVVSVAASVIVVLAVPLSQLRLGEDVSKSAVFWLGMAAVGLVALLVAVFLERGRARFRESARRLADLTRGWE